MQTQTLGNLEIIRKTKGAIPVAPFNEVKEKILGKSYQLELSFVSTKESAVLHEKFKKKSGPANVLSFPLDKDNGQIIISLYLARKNARLYKHRYSEHIIFLFIHGCLHLAGHTHSDEMDQLEEKYLKLYKSL